MDNLYHLTQKVLTAAGGTPSPGDSRSALLKKLLVAKGGTPTWMDNEPSLWRKIATAVGVTVDSADGTWQSLFKSVEGAQNDDSEWQLMNRLYRNGFRVAAEEPLPAPPEPPTNLGDGGDITETQFTLTFTESSGATSYRLDIGDGFDFSVYVVGYQDLEISGSPFLVTGLTTASIYSVRLRAVGPGGTSGNSEVVLVTTV